MTSTLKLLVGGSLVVWTLAVASRVVQGFSPGSTPPPALKGWTTAGPHDSAIQPATTNSGVFTKAQADGAKAQFEKLCAECHPFTVAGKKKLKDKPLGEEPFFEEWSGRTLEDLATLIALTMPNDGSASVTDKEALELVAYMLHQNGFAPGSKPLTKETATAVIERPLKK